MPSYISAHHKPFSEGTSYCDIPAHVMTKLTVRPVQLQITANFENINTNVRDVRLFLNTAGTNFIDVPNGLYWHNDLNRLLTDPVGGLYYKILIGANGLQYDIVEYASEGDRNNETGGTV